MTVPSKNKLQGIVPPVITPLNPDCTLDVQGLEILLEHIIRGGVHGLFILGTTGEGPALGLRLQKDMIRETMRIVNGRLPVLVGISNASMADTLEIAEYSYQQKADAVVCAPPCYFALGDDELFDFFSGLVANIKLPLYLYNMPAMTKVTMKPSLIVKLAQLPGIVGYKDSTGNMCDLHEVILALKDRTDFSIFVGPEELTAEAVLFGADGGVNGGANLHPELFVAMYNAAKADDMQTIRKLQQEIYEQRKLYSLGRYQSSIIKGIKSALSIRGICKDTMVIPFQAFKVPERSKVQDILNKLS